MYFESSAAFRAWLREQHAREAELWVGFHKKATGRPSLTWNESVDQALAYGWIDGVRRSVDAERYAIRFTPRRPKGIWSAKNLQRYAELEARGRIEPAGRAAFEARDAEKTQRYSFERENVRFDESQQREFRKHPKAWKFFQSQPPSYRKPATWWVVSAKREATRAKRLATLIADSEAGCRIALLRR